MTYDKQQIIKLRLEGKTHSDIALIMGCSLWTIKYHLSPNRKRNQVKYDKKIKINNPLLLKRKRFLSVKNNITIFFTLNELKSKLGKHPKCYLTGKLIDLNKPNTYSLDHIIPVSRGGENSLKNLALMSKDVNQAKWNLTLDEFIKLCNDVVNHTKNWESPPELNRDHAQI